MKKLMIYSLIACGLLFNVSCDSDELAAGAIGVGVGVGLGEHYDRHHHRHDHRFVDDAGSVAINGSSSAQVFAARHNIPLSAARRIEAAFNGLDNQGLASLRQVGLNEQDVRVIAAQGMPGASSIHNMAVSLNLPDQQCHRLLSELNQTFAAQASDVNSDYWQACMEKGAWRTPQNSNCRSTAWNGCSPETGANACY